MITQYFKDIKNKPYVICPKCRTKNHITDEFNDSIICVNPKCVYQMKLSTTLKFKRQSDRNRLKELNTIIEELENRISDLTEQINDLTE